MTANLLSTLQGLTGLPYVYRWDRQGRKGQRCAVTARAKVMNSIRVEFEDGFTMITSGNAIRRAKEARSDAHNS